MSWSVFDQYGNRKLSQFGGASSLTDPVTVAHGGTGLITVSQGDLLYASADGVISKLAKDTGGTRVLTNLGSNNNPAWKDPASALGGIPNPTTRKFSFIEFSGSTTPSAFSWAAAANASSAQVDSISQWGRYSTTNVSANTNGLRLSADWAWIDHLPKVNLHLRTGSTIAAVRIWLVISNVGGAFLSDADDQHALKGIGIRYSTVAVDPGWVGWTSDGTTQTIGSQISSIVASTLYSMTIEATATNSVTFTVNGSSQTMAIPSGALGTVMRFNAQLTTKAGVIKDLDLAALYGEWN